MEDEDSTIVALLHDVVEDTNYSLKDIKGMGFGDNIIEALELLTHNPETPYMEYIRAISANTLARKIKLADLEHNSDASRLNHAPTEADLQRIDKYEQAMAFLKSINSGV